LPAQVGVPGIDQTYDEIAINAVKGILNNISEEGELLQTSFGTEMGDILQYNKDIPKTAMPMARQ
jgi:unsaturated rhamnogalacturonyl hydrolase